MYSYFTLTRIFTHFTMAYFIISQYVTTYYHFVKGDMSHLFAVLNISLKFLN
jgi:hypothetical protein